MIFVTGPFCSGKQEYIMNALGLSDEEFRANAVRDAHLLAFQYDTKEGAELGELSVLADTLAKKQVVISDELGCGVVPATPEERRMRESAGRLSIMLAERADTVIRVYMGIPQILKGELPE